MPQFIDCLLFFEILIVDQLKQLVVLTSIEHKYQCLFVHQILEKNLEAEIGRQVFFLLLEQLEEVLFELLLLIRSYQLLVVALS